VAVVVGVIAVRFHYFTDTVAGAAVGTGTVCGLALVLDLIPAGRPGYRAGPRRHDRPPARRRRAPARAAEPASVPRKFSP
jgi:membrane-associated phospholipid phosphatase